MNKLCKNMLTGTVGELLVQLRLLQYGVQAAPPLKDSGNDLIAVRGSVFKAIQIKTTAGAPEDISQNIKRQFHVLAIVALKGEDNDLNLNDSQIFLLEKDQIQSAGGKVRNLDECLLTATRVESIFGIQAIE